MREFRTPALSYIIYRFPAFVYPVFIFFTICGGVLDVYKRQVFLLFFSECFQTNSIIPSKPSFSQRFFHSCVLFPKLLRNRQKKSPAQRDSGENCSRIQLSFFPWERIAARSGSTNAAGTLSSSMPMDKKSGSIERSAASSPQIPTQIPALCAACALSLIHIFRPDQFDRALRFQSHSA